MATDTPIDERALDSLSVAPADPAASTERSATDERQQAGQDESIARRLEDDPENGDARLDNALDESMDASDPPASTQPVHNHGAPASSGFDAEEEARRARDA